MDSKFDSEPLGKTDFCSCLKNGICAGDTIVELPCSLKNWLDAFLLWFICRPALSGLHNCSVSATGEKGKGEEVG